jgi:hypothetical protein
MARSGKGSLAASRLCPTVGVFEHGRAIVVEVFIVDDSLGAVGQYLSEPLLTFEKQLITQIVALQFNHIEGGKRYFVRSPSNAKCIKV